MARTDKFTGLSEFLAVANHASFRAAAAELGVTPAAVSQAVRALETRTGLPLFQRTTRNVALTEAGARLLSRLSPAATEIGDALDALGVLRQRPAGKSAALRAAYRARPRHAARAAGFPKILPGDHA